MYFYHRKRLNICLVCVCVWPQDLSQCVTCKEKHITVKKEPHESLGMTVAGGRGSKSGELPIFVTSVQPHGCLSRDGRIKRGERPPRNDKEVHFDLKRHSVPPLFFRWRPAEHQWTGPDVSEPRWSCGHPKSQRCLTLRPAAGAGGQHGGGARPRRAAASHTRQRLWC